MALYLCTEHALCVTGLVALAAIERCVVLYRTASTPTYKCAGDAMVALAVTEKYSGIQ